MFLRHVRFPVTHLGMSTGEGIRTLKTLFLRQRRMPFRHSCITVSLVRLELTVDLSPARVLSPPHMPILLQRQSSTSGEIRTLIAPVLSRAPLPIGIRKHLVGRAGFEPATFSARVTDLQSVGFT